MRATGIRYNPKNGGGKPTERYLEDLCEIIVSRMARAGFKTDAYKLTGSAIKIGLHMSSFRIDTQKLGYNGRVDRFTRELSPKGYKRTDVPTWDQRVEFNDLLNGIFDKFGLISNIKSGPFTVRDKKIGAWSEHDWKYQTPDYLSRGDEIMPESEARSYCDSDRLEAEYREKTKVLRSEQGKQYRARIKAFKSAKRVVVDGFYSWKGKPTKNGKLLTHNQFSKLLEKMDSSWERRRVKLASIQATAETNKPKPKPVLTLVVA